MERTRIRLIDIAREAGVSAKTVSRVVNDESGVSKPVRDAIRQTIDRLGFRPNHAARALKVNSTRTVMLMTSRVESLYAAAAIRGALNACRDSGFHLVVEEYRPADLARVLRDLDSNPVDAAVLLPPVCDDPALLAALRDRDIRLSRLSPATPLPDASEIGCREFDGAAMLARHFREIGHDRVAILLGMPGHRATTLRGQGFSQGWRAAGGSDAGILALEWGDYGAADDEPDRDGADFPLSMVDLGAVAARRLLARADRPTAIFAFNDAIAIGVMWGAREAGFAIPADLSVAGFDGSLAASLVRPRLTTIHQPVAAMAHAAVMTLTDPNGAIAPVFDVALMPGETTAPPTASMRVKMLGGQ